MRKSADKSNRVNEHKRSSVGEFERTGGNVKRCEKLILGENSCLSKGVHKRRFADISVADYRTDKNIVLFAARTVLLTAAFKLL